MNIDISNHAVSVVERGVYYFAPQNYPRLTPREIKDILNFIAYEKSHGRQAEVICNNEGILQILNSTNFATIEDVPYCEFIYHATDLKAANQILTGGNLLSATEVYNKSGAQLAFEKNGSLWNDPPDYFEYIMFGWGDSEVGDYVVISENSDCEKGDEFFAQGTCAGVRFYFQYADLLRHPGCAFDGYHPLKIQEKIVLSEYLYACIVPEQYKGELNVLPEFAEKVHYLPQIGLGISDWTKKCYNFVITRKVLHC
ncbi:hypothetical protein FACS1894219_09840 [Clostridia bacterium]|nr:hypothetical protein FACS1894219_09840 [Clostridia bacterium]